MIVSKPKISTLFSVGVFIVAAFAVAIYAGVQATNSEGVWWYVLTYTTGPIGLLVLIKILSGIKHLSVSKEKFTLSMPFIFKKLSFNGKEIEKWSHSSIKTYGGKYEELTWQLRSGKKFGISKQENTAFDKLLKYMKKKYKKVQVSAD